MSWLLMDPGCRFSGTVTFAFWCLGYSTLPESLRVVYLAAKWKAHGFLVVSCRKRAFCCPQGVLKIQQGLGEPRSSHLFLLTPLAKHTPGCFLLLFLGVASVSGRNRFTVRHWLLNGGFLLCLLCWIHWEWFSCRCLYPRYLWMERGAKRPYWEPPKPPGASLPPPRGLALTPGLSPPIWTVPHRTLHSPSPTWTHTVQ